MGHGPIRPSGVSRGLDISGVCISDERIPPTPALARALRQELECSRRFTCHPARAGPSVRPEGRGSDSPRGIAWELDRPI
jgi:hypothetical protein